MKKFSFFVLAAIALVSAFVTSCVPPQEPVIDFAGTYQLDCVLDSFCVNDQWFDRETAQSGGMHTELKGNDMVISQLSDGKYQVECVIRDDSTNVEYSFVTTGTLDNKNRLVVEKNSYNISETQYVIGFECSPIEYAEPLKFRMSLSLSTESCIIMVYDCKATKILEN